MKRQIGICILAITAVVTALVLQGCGGGGGSDYNLPPGFSTVSGTVSTINKDTIMDAQVSIGDHDAKSLVSGVYRLDDVESGWKTAWATATIGGERWVGSTAVEVLYNEPTMNANIVLAPEHETTTIRGVVTDDSGYGVYGARVLLTTRIVYPAGDTSAYDGPYGSIVAITDYNGNYTMEDVPIGFNATISASKVGFKNDEVELKPITEDDEVDFNLVVSNLRDGPGAPVLAGIESYTVPNTITRSDADAYKAIKAFTSEKFRKALSNKKETMTRATPLGSLIEIDLYWNAFGLDEYGDPTNDSRDIAGYGVYRKIRSTDSWDPIDFVRDPYASYYGDTGSEITPGATYRYAVSTVDVEFINEWTEEFDPESESYLSNSLLVQPLGQLRASLPVQGARVSAAPTFTWSQLDGANTYTVYVYSKFPTLPLDPSYDYGSDPIVDAGVFPVWPTKDNIDASTVGGSATSIHYNGPVLVSGHTYYWVILATDDSGTAYSYSQLRKFTVQ